MEEKKTSTLALLKILEEETDADHMLSCPELQQKLSDQYGLDLDRRTLYKNVDMLKSFGYDISTFSDNGKGYYLVERPFEQSEIFVLCNAIHASNFIPQKASNELIKNLLATQSKQYRNGYRSMVFIENDKKKDNKEFFYNVEIISDAIKNKKVISFNYTKYDINKKLINRRDEPYIYSPYYMVYNADKTYMIAKSDKHEDFTHFRIDRMKNVKILEDNRYIVLRKNEDPYQYAKSKIYMYQGVDESISIKCDYSILDDIIDTFGKDITIIPGKNSFTAYVRAAKEGMLYYALQYINYLEVLEPKELRKEIKEALGNAQKKYK